MRAIGPLVPPVLAGPQAEHKYKELRNIKSKLNITRHGFFFDTLKRGYTVYLKEQ